MVEEGRNNGSRLLLGIDLGTSRTAIMSDRGYRNIIPSVVGYPKDIIGVKMLGKTQVFGDEALQRRSALTLYHPLQDGVVRETGDGDYNAAAELIRHVVRLAREGVDGEAYGIIGVPARASIVNKELLLGIAREILSSVMVVSEPFMVAYAMDKFNNAIVVDIGGGTVDICGMKGTVPGVEDQITLAKGGDYIDERLEEAIVQRYPEIQMTTNLARLIKEKYAFVGNPLEPVRVTLRAEGRPR
ncbi:MAG: rod shape-determining protein, partial [Desulfobulbaceae bacterium]|nr:rod shape-determining protein [Desulfobulbaceae bacterium]